MGSSDDPSCDGGEVDDDACDDGDRKDYSDDDEGVLPRSVRAEEDCECDAAIDEKSRHQCSCGDRAADEELADDDARCAVRDQSHDCGKDICEHGLIEDDQFDRLLADEVDEEIEHEREDEYKERDLARMDQGALEKIIVAMALIPLAELVDLDGRLAAAFFIDRSEHEVDSDARDDRYDELDRKYFEHRDQI